MRLVSQRNLLSFIDCITQKFSCGFQREILIHVGWSCIRSIGEPLREDNKLPELEDSELLELEDSELLEFWEI